MMKKEASCWAGVIAGACGLAIAFGVVRFDFGLLGRLMSDFHWIAPSGIGDLSGLNLAGYLTGCLHQARLRKRKNLLLVLKVALVVAVLSLWLESFQTVLAEQGICRFLAGWAAGHLMTGLPQLALFEVPQAHKRAATGGVMAGGGIGALIGAFAIAKFAPDSPQMAWIVLALISSVLSLPVFWLLNRRKVRQLDDGTRPESLTPHKSDQKPVIRMLLEKPLLVLLLGYVSLGAAQVPVILYEPLVISGRLGIDSVATSDSLAILGLGSAAGAFLASCFPRKWSTSYLLIVTSVLGLIGNILFLCGQNMFSVELAAFLVGAWLWVITSLTFHRIEELFGADMQRQLWAFFSLFAGSAFMLFSFLSAFYVARGIEVILFAGVVLMVIHLAMEILQRFLSPARASQG
ncbi:MAG: YbfB/YjiJ family MFS transporter [Prochlorococcus sp.]